MSDFKRDKPRHMEVYHQGQDYLTKLQGWEVSDEASAAEAGDMLVEVHAKLKLIEKERTDITGDMNNALRKTNAFFKKVRSPFESMKEVLKGKLLGWEETQQASRQLAEAQLDETETEDPEELKTLLVASVAQAKRAKGVKVRKSLTYDLVDFEKVPDKFKMVDKAAVRQHLKDHGIEGGIPGLNLRVEEKITL